MSDLRDYFKKWPGFYFFVATVFGPMLFCGVSAKKFLREYPRAGKTLNLGSGPRVYSGYDVINIDIYEYPGVSLVADVCEVPLPDRSISRIVSDNVLEHVKTPQLAVGEMYRLLESGGLAYISTPFMYPFHSSPSDYQRWTKLGLLELFREFEVVSIGVRAGPFSAFDAYLCHVTGIIFSFGNAPLKSLIINLAMFVFFPIKLLDLIFNHWPGADELAAVFYVVVRKP